MTIRSRRLLGAAVLAGGAIALGAGTAAASESDTTTVSGTVAQVLSISATDSVSVGALTPGVTSTAGDGEVKVIANSGYDLTAALTAGGTNGTLEMQATAPSGATAAGFGSYTALGAAASMGGRASGGTTSSTGDVWGTSFKATASGFPAVGTPLSWTVTFTATSN